MHNHPQRQSLFRLRQYYEAVQGFDSEQIDAIQSDLRDARRGMVDTSQFDTAWCAWNALTPDEKEAVLTGPLFLQAVGFNCLTLNR